MVEAQTDSEGRPEQELLAAAQAGERAAIESLIARYQSRVFRFGMKMCRDPEDAKDVLQETLIAMVRTVRDFRGAASLSTWLYGIARSFCIKKRRKSKFAPVETSLDSEATREAAQLADPQRDPEEQAGARRIHDALEQGIAALEPMYREVLLLRDVEGLTAPEVAEVLQLSVAAVKSRLHRARAAVREHVAPLLQPPEPAAAGASCPNIVDVFSRYLEDEISPQHCEEMQRHLDNCDHCEQTCDTLRETLSMCQRVPAPAIPAEVQHAVREAVQNFLDSQ